MTERGERLKKFKTMNEMKPYSWQNECDTYDDMIERYIDIYKIKEDLKVKKSKPKTKSEPEYNKLLLLVA